MVIYRDLSITFGVKTMITLIYIMMGAKDQPGYFFLTAYVITFKGQDVKRQETLSMNPSTNCKKVKVYSILTEGSESRDVTK